MQVLTRKENLGSRIVCREDERFVRGVAEYSDDVVLRSPCYVSFVRSTQAHARIVNIDIGKAAVLPGVIDVITSSELKHLVEPVVRGSFRVVPGGELVYPKTYYGLAEDKVTYVGEPLVAILATSRAIAEDAVEEVEVDYEPLETVSDPEAAMLESSPLIYENWKKNTIYKLKLDEGHVDDIIGSSPKAIKARFSIPRQTVISIEPRCCSAVYDKGRDTLTVWTSTQSPHIQRSIMAKILRLPENKIRLISRDVGGAFGLKNCPFIETIIAGLFALRSGYPVKWTETRTESILTFHAREQLHEITVGVDLNGKILALKAKVIANHGAYYATPGTKSIMNTAVFLPGCYDIRNYSGDLSCVVTNKAPYTAYRGFGKSEASFVIERTVDVIARDLGIDPAVVRLRNFISANNFPYTSVTGAMYDSGEYEKCFNKLLTLIDYDKLRHQQAKERSRGRFMGIGLSFSLAPGGSANPDSLYSGFEAAHIRISPDGSITVLTGVSSQGQSHETAIAQAVSDEFGVSMSRIRVFEGDTELCPYGLGAWSDRTSVKGLPAAISCSRILKDKLTAVASKLLQVPGEDIEFSDERIFSKTNSNAGILFNELVWKMYTQHYLLPFGIEPGLEAIQYVSTNNVRYFPDHEGNFSLYPTFGYCACAVVVFVDPETGSVKFDRVAVVDDSGKIANPLIVESQLQGAIVQGFGSAMLEEVKYDDNGQVINSTLMDYLIPSAESMPSPEVEHLETPSPFVLGGFKSVGEAGTIAMTPAVANAICDALAPLGVRTLDPPFTPEKIQRAFSKTPQ